MFQNMSVSIFKTSTCKKFIFSRDTELPLLLSLPNFEIFPQCTDIKILMVVYSSTITSVHETRDFLEPVLKSEMRKKIHSIFLKV